MGNRIYKKIAKGGGGPDKHTIYQRDAQGNTLAVYDNHVKSSEFIACKYDAKDIELVFEDIERAYDNCQPKMDPSCIEKEIERLRDKIADKDPCTQLIYEYIWSQNQPCHLDEQYRSLIEQFYNDNYDDYHSQADAASKEDFLSSKANDIGDAHKMSKEQLDCFKEKLRRAMDMDQDKFNTYFNNLKNGIEYEQWKADIIDWLVNNGQSYTKHTDEIKNGKIYWQEQHLYGSKRLGMALPKRDITDHSIPPYESWLVGRQYELTNHLGNVLATIKDEKKQYSKTGSKVDYYKPFITSSTDYYPFGMQMPNRSFSLSSSNYRYSFNGKEREDEIYGEGNAIDFGARVYDGRIGRFFSLDPLSRKYPELSPYSFAANNPIWMVDRDGEEPTLAAYKNAAKKLGVTVAQVRTVYKTEVGANGYFSDGKIKILFERHYFRRHTDGKYNNTHSNLSGPQGNYGKYSEQYPKYNEAKALDPEAAAKSISIGGFQIMGENYEAAGFSSAEEFVEAMTNGSEDDHLEAFTNFILNNKDKNGTTKTKHQALKDKDWKAFARNYNGPNYHKNNYDTEMKSNYDTFKDNETDGLEDNSTDSREGVFDVSHKMIE